MNDARKALALRRELLVTRASLQRLRVANDVLSLREALRWPLAGGASWVSSGPARLGMLGLLMLAGRRGSRSMRIAAVAIGTALFVARLAQTTSTARSVAPASPPQAD